MIDFSKLNWDRVFDVLTAQPIPDWDKELVATAVEKAVEKWGPVDRHAEIVSTEIYSDDPFPHKIDIHLNDPSIDRNKVVDWKTKKAGKLDDRWTLKQERSWQPRLYAAIIATKYGADVFPILFEIRGIVLAEKPETRTISMVFTRADAVGAINYMRQMEAQRGALVTGGKIPWIRDPQGCRMFGDMYKCEFEGICWPGADPMNPLVQVPTGNMERAEKAFSHSSASEYLRCPERYRLLRVLDKEDEDDAITGAGSAFHACMEEIYTQLKLVTEETGRVSEASKEMNPNG